MAINIANMKKDEIVKRSFYKCKHGHTGLAHPSCYNEETGTEERIGYLDIETTELVANFGMILCYCIKKNNGEIIKRLITPEEIKDGTYDKNLVKQLCEDMRQFDRIITYYGARFDLPFIRTRAEYFKLDFPTFKELKHTDIFDTVKRKFRFSRRGLGTVCKFFGIESKASPLDSPDWKIKCISGNVKALEYVLTHCIEDVISTEELWQRVNKYARITDTSI